MPISAKWKREIARAQHDRTLYVGDVEYPRLRHVDEYGDGKARCRDCAVRPGQFHVFNCCVERCPRCKTRQAIGCNCFEMH